MVLLVFLFFVSLSGHTRRHGPFKRTLQVLTLDITTPRYEDGPPPTNRTDYNILILIPFSERMPRMKEYLTLLSTLTYPRGRISIGIGQYRDDESEFIKLASEFEHFREILPYRYAPHARTTATDSETDIDPLRGQHETATRKNELLIRALKAHHQWVVWMDADLEYFPPNLIELMLSPNRAIVAPICVTKPPSLSERHPGIRHESEATPDEHLARKQAKNSRYVFNKQGGEVVMALDEDMEECVILVNASYHRQGLIFPPFQYPFDSRVMTGGLSKMAINMGIPMYGLPFVHVFRGAKKVGKSERVSEKPAGGAELREDRYAKHRESRRRGQEMEGERKRFGDNIRKEEIATAQRNS